MSKQHFVTSALALVALTAVAGTARAGSIEYLTNQSADYIRTFSRNASTDGVDIAVFNPAGTVYLPEGMHLGVSSQTLIGEYAIELDGKRYPSDVFVPVLPSLHAVYNKKLSIGTIAAFGALTIPAGGGSLDYKEGLPYLTPLSAFTDQPGAEPKNGTFAGKSLFYGGTLGVAWDILGRGQASLSVGGRYVIAKKSFDGSVDYNTTHSELHTKKDAAGFAGIVGLHIRAIPGMELGFRYEMPTPLEFKTRTTTTGLLPMDKWKGKALESFADGATEQRDLPATFGAGLMAHPMKGLRVSASYHRYFIKDADAKEDPPGAPGTKLGAYTISYDDDYDDGWDAAISVEYDVRPSLTASLGVIRADIGGNKDTYGDFEYALDSDSVGAGVRYGMLDDKLKLTLGISRTFYKDGKNDKIDGGGLPPFMLTPNGETFTKRVLDIALGAQYSF